MRPSSVLAFVAVVALAGACRSGPDPIRGIERAPIPVVAKATLPDATNGGKPFRFEASKDHVLLVYFGYTSCPDICPTTLSALRTALGKLGEKRAARVDLAMVTVDPTRDTGPVLSRYVRSFVPAAHALVTRDETSLRMAAEAFGADYLVTPGAEGEEPEVGHSAFVYAVDDEGQLDVTWSFGTTPDDFAHDLGILLRR